MLHYHHSRHDRSTALRSDMIMLSMPSTLQGRSDFPAPVTRPCGFYTACTRLTASRSHTEMQGPQVQRSYSFTACHWPYPGSCAGAHALCFPAHLGLLHSRRGSACILSEQQVCPASGLSQLFPSGVSLRGCTIRFMLRPAVLAGIPDWVKPMPAISQAKAVATPCRGKFSPCVTTRTRPQPTYPKGQLI